MIIVVSQAASRQPGSQAATRPGGQAARQDCKDARADMISV